MSASENPDLPHLGRYDILERIGEGGAAVVYKARDRELDRIVAIKVLRERAGFSPVARERFHREARASGSLSHPNVITVHDFSVEDARPYLVMEYVDGRPLGSGGWGDPRTVVRLLEKAARGVAAAHAKGVVHRDLKPGNILVDSHGEPKVADFGLAHLMTSMDHLTRTGATLGTPLYMAPEQIEARAGDITPRTDVYALGTILYEALSGRVPFPGETMPEITHKILHDEPGRPPGPGDLAVICAKAMEKDPDRRYSTAAEFADDLARYLDGRPIEARPPSAGYRAGRWIVRYRTAILGVTAATLLVLVTGLVAFQGSDEPVARTIQVQGQVYRLAESKRQPLLNAEPVRSGEGVETSGPDSRATLKFPDGTEVALGGDTRVIDLAEGNESRRLFVVQGVVKALLPGPTPLHIRTSHATAESSAGRLTLSVSHETVLEVWEGSASFSRPEDPQALAVPAGHFSVAARGRELAALRLLGTTSGNPVLFTEDFENAAEFRKRWRFTDTTLPSSCEGRLEVRVDSDKEPPAQKPYEHRVSTSPAPSFELPIRVSVDVEITGEALQYFCGLRIHGSMTMSPINIDLMGNQYLLLVGKQSQARATLDPYPRRERWTLEIDGDRNVRFRVNDREVMKAKREDPDTRFGVTILVARKAGPAPRGNRVRFDNFVVERLPR